MSSELPGDEFLPELGTRKGSYTRSDLEFLFRLYEEEKLSFADVVRILELEGQGLEGKEAKSFLQVSSEKVMKVAHQVQKRVSPFIKPLKDVRPYGVIIGKVDESRARRWYVDPIVEEFKDAGVDVKTRGK